MLCKLCIKATMTKWVRAGFVGKGSRKWRQVPALSELAMRPGQPDQLLQVLRLERGWWRLLPLPSYCKAYVRKCVKNQFLNWKLIFMYWLSHVLSTRICRVQDWVPRTCRWIRLSPCLRLSRDKDNPPPNKQLQTTMRVTERPTGTEMENNWGVGMGIMGMGE